MSRISLAFKSFFGILFGDGLPEAVARAYGYVKESAVKQAPKAAAPQVGPSDGALQILGILQRDARLIDIIMDPAVATASDDQIGAAFRTVQPSLRETLLRYVQLRPVIDAVENTSTTVPSRDPASIKLVGNVDKGGNQGILRHKGWRAERVDLPKTPGNVNVLAPAEIEIE